MSDYSVHLKISLPFRSPTIDAIFAMEINFVRLATLTLCVVACIVLIGSTGSDSWVEVIDQKHDDIIAATYGVWKVCIWQRKSYKTMSCQYWHETDDTEMKVWKFRKDNTGWFDVVCAVSVLACIFSVISVISCIWSLVRPAIKKLDISVIVSLAMTVVLMSVSIGYFAAKYDGMFPMYLEKLSWAYAASVSGLVLFIIAFVVELASFLRGKAKSSQIV